MKKGSKAEDGYNNCVVLLPYNHKSPPIYFDDVKDAAENTGKEEKTLYSVITHGTRINYLGKKWFADYAIPYWERRK